MFKLQIKKQDGSPYWTEVFNDRDSAEKWLAEEKTRKYWDLTYTTSIVEMNPIDPVQKEQERVKSEQDKIKADARRLKKEQAEVELKSFDLSRIKDADARQAIKFILDKIEGL